MIIKMIPIKSVACRAVLRYINKPAPELRSKQPLTRNIGYHRDELSRIEAQFLENMQYLKQRKGGILFYHHIISLSKQDKEHANEEILKDLTSKWLELVAPKHLAYSKVQWDKENHHSHILLSSNSLRGDKRLHLNNREFDRVRRELEQYQQQKYPQLTHSIVFNQKKQQQQNTIRKSRKEHERDRYYKGLEKVPPPSRKEQIREQLLTIFTFAMSQSDFVKQCKEEDLTPYGRGDNETLGVQTKDGYKYQFKTLGLADFWRREQRSWKELPKFMQRMKQIEIMHLEQEYVEPLQYKEDIQQVLNQTPDQYQSLDEQQKASMRRIDQHHKYSRSRGREDFMKGGRDIDDDFGLGRWL